MKAHGGFESLAKSYSIDYMLRSIVLEVYE